MSPEERKIYERYLEILAREPYIWDTDITGWLSKKRRKNIRKHQRKGKHFEKDVRPGEQEKQLWTRTVRPRKKTVQAQGGKGQTLGKERPARGERKPLGKDCPAREKPRKGHTAWEIPR